MKKVYRYEVPIDDKPHTIALRSLPFPHVEVVVKNLAAPDENWVVEFWAEYDDSLPEKNFVFQVFGTGHELPDNAWWMGTAARTMGLISHLYKL